MLEGAFLEFWMVDIELNIYGMQSLNAYCGLVGKNVTAVFWRNWTNNDGTKDDIMFCIWLDDVASHSLIS